MLLYKYLKSEQKYILENGLIRFTQPSCFNDPFEALPKVEQVCSLEIVDTLYKDFNNDLLFNDLISRIDNPEAVKNLEIAREVFKKNGFSDNKELFYDRLLGNTEEDLTTEMKKFWDSQFGILCFTENYDNMTMWSHYSENHTGFVIGFNPIKNITDPKKRFAKPWKVKYTANRPRITLFNLDKKDGTTFHSIWIQVFLYTKSIHWVHENEWRQVNKLNCCDKKELKNNEEIFLFDYNRESIEEIVLGCMIRPAVEKEIIQIVNNWNVKIFKMRLNENNYTLDKIQIK